MRVFIKSYCYLLSWVLLLSLGYLPSSEGKYKTNGSGERGAVKKIERSGGRENCSWDVFYEKNKFKKERNVDTVREDWTKARLNSVEQINPRALSQTGFILKGLR